MPRKTPKKHREGLFNPRKKRSRPNRGWFGTTHQDKTRESHLGKKMDDLREEIGLKRIKSKKRHRMER